MSGLSRRELVRQLVHFGVCLPALALPFLPRLATAGIAAGAILGNAFVLPRLPWTRTLFRPGEKRVGGIVLYPTMVLIMVCVLPYPATAAGAWALLGCGDAASSLAGRAWGRRRLPWNADKSWVGTAAFVIGGGLGTAAALLWCGVEPASAWRDAALAAILAAAVESLPLPVDDNISVSVVGGGSLWWLARWGP